MHRVIPATLLFLGTLLLASSLTILPTDTIQQTNLARIHTQSPTTISTQDTLSTATHSEGGYSNETNVLATASGGVPTLSVLGWIPYWDQKEAVASFRENVDVFDFISLFWYRIDSAGELATYHTVVQDEDIIEFAHEHDVKVFVIVANLPDYPEGGDWDYRRVGRVIGSKEARDEHIEDLLQLTEELDVDGINIDYEALQRNQRDDFTAFIQELGEALHKQGKLLGVAIHPKTSEGNPSESNGSEAQDWEAIHPYVDQLYFMTYGEHYLESRAGPIASQGWVERVMQYAVEEVGVPPEKIFMGIPLYAQMWYRDSDNSETGVDKDVHYESLMSMAAKYDGHIGWDTGAASPFLVYGRDDTEYIAWFENEKSIETKMEIANSYRINNFAFWRLGGENEKLWPLLRERKEEGQSTQP